MHYIYHQYLHVFQTVPIYVYVKYKYMLNMLNMALPPSALQPLTVTPQHFHRITASPSAHQLGPRYEGKLMSDGGA